MRRKLILPGICALLLCPSLIRAEDTARIPYELIYQIQKTEAGLRRVFTNLDMELRMNPTLPGVGIPDVVVYIASTNGRIPVTLNSTNGSFSLPLLDSLVAEQAWVVANQPKGTMNFEWFVGLKVGELPTNGMHYSEVMRPLKALEVIRGEMRKIPGAPLLNIYGLKLAYSDDKEAAVVVHARSGDRVFKTNANHALVIPYEQSLMEEDPEVSIPVKPEKVDVANTAGGS